MGQAISAISDFIDILNENGNARQSPGQRARQSDDVIYSTRSNYIPERRQPEIGVRVFSRPTDFPISQPKRYNRLIDAIVTESPNEVLVSMSLWERQEVLSLISDINVGIKGMYKVKNDFLKGMYEWKKEEYKSRYSCSLNEMLLIHATSRSNVANIIKENFDWRRVRRSKYGRGTSFTNNADYANVYCNRNNGNDRAFIICKVLISRSCGGNNNAIPPKDFDTTTRKYNRREIVFVKYSDNECLPIYVVYYQSSSSVINCSKFKSHLNNRNSFDYY